MLQLNYLLKVHLFLIFLCSMLSYANLGAQNIFPERKAYLLDSISNNPSGKIYFFDGIEISEVDFYKKGFAGELNGLVGTGAEPGKDGVIRYGEYYRNGVIILDSKENQTMKPKIQRDKNFIPKAQKYKDGYQLRGIIDEAFEGEPIMLFSFDNNHILNVDTALIIDCRFQFDGKENLKDIGILTVGNFPDTITSSVVFLEKGNIEINMNTGRVSGTALNNLYQGYLDTCSLHNREYGELPYNEEQPNLIVTNSPRYHKLVEMGKYMVEFKKQNIHNAVGQYLFEKEVGISFAESFAYPSTETYQDSAFHTIYSAADEDYKQRKWIESYIKSLNRWAESATKVKQLTGKPYIDFTLTDLSGESKELSQYIANSRYTLIDFWASWCGPCIASFPKLKEVYESSDRTKFEVIGVSLDTRLSDWERTIDKHELPWIQLVSGDEALNKEMQSGYGFAGIPFTILLDHEGNIIRTNISIYELLEMVEELN